MRRRNNHFLEQLKQRREAAKSTEEPVPKGPQPELPTDPTIRSELLADELRDARQELERERRARQEAERRAEQQARPASLRDFLHMRQIHKRRSWR